MSFAEEYLIRNTIFENLFTEVAKPDTGIIVTIPAFSEPSVVEVLDSLAACDPPACHVEVIIYVNAPARASDNDIEQNRIAVLSLMQWRKNNKDAFFNLLIYESARSVMKDWGVGLARKVIMDEAAGRFSSTGREDGVIVCLDADCRVDSNYFTAIQQSLLERKDRKACSIYFEHPLSGELDERIYNAVAQYELHMRYYYQMLRYTGFPDVFHTIGSAMAVKAVDYVLSGGMNRKQGGEDFYFIQKLIPRGGFFYLTDTTVRPSSRSSLRVPFGTGPVIEAMAEKDDAIYMTYDPAAFEDLLYLFGNISALYRGNEADYTIFLKAAGKGMAEFLESNLWIKHIDEIRDNTSSVSSFTKRFYSWFNMFRIVKYLNYVHANGFFVKQDVIRAAARCLEMKGLKYRADSVYDLLGSFRMIEKNN